MHLPIDSYVPVNLQGAPPTDVETQVSGGPSNYSLHPSIKVTPKGRASKEARIAVRYRRDAYSDAQEEGGGTANLYTIEGLGDVNNNTLLSMVANEGLDLTPSPSTTDAAAPHFTPNVIYHSNRSFAQPISSHLIALTLTKLRIWLSISWALVPLESFSPFRHHLPLSCTSCLPI